MVNVKMCQCDDLKIWGDTNTGEQCQYQKAISISKRELRFQMIDP